MSARICTCRNPRWDILGECCSTNERSSHDYTRHLLGVEPTNSGAAAGPPVNAAVPDSTPGVRGSEGNQTRGGARPVERPGARRGTRGVAFGESVRPVPGGTVPPSRRRFWLLLDPLLNRLHLGPDDAAGGRATGRTDWEQ